MQSDRTGSVRAFLLAIAAVLLVAAPSAHAEWLLATSTTRIVAGESLKVSVVRDADGEHLPDRLDVVVETGERRVSGELVALPDGDPRAFRREYQMTWPDGVAGQVVLLLAGRSSSRLLLAALEAPPPPASGEPVAPEPRAPVAAVPSEPALSPNEPMYFLLGLNDETSARFQLSFKYRIFDPESPVVEFVPPLRGLHFGYTQTSLWDLGEESKPFRDTSYRPSLFYQWSMPTAPASRHAVGVRTGYEHESNGRNAERSRSIDMLFALVDWRYDLGGSYVAVTPKLWVYLDKDENPDIHRYRGYGEIGLRFGRDRGWLAQLRVRGPATGGRHSTQADLSYPLTRRILSDTSAYLHFQVFTGVGETLLDYNRSRGTQYRIGLSILR